MKFLAGGVDGPRVRPDGNRYDCDRSSGKGSAELAVSITYTLLSPWAALAAVGASAAVAYLICHVADLELSNVGRLGCIDGVRGMLALCVLFHHYVHAYVFHVSGQWTPDHSRFYKVIGPDSVLFFFMITGYLFWDKLLAQRGTVDWRKLYLSRIFRVVPLYWVAVAIIVFFVFSTGLPGIHVPIATLLDEIADWLFFYGTPDVNAYSDTSRIVAKVTWTLRYEWMFYLSLPFLALVLRASRRTPSILWQFAAAILALALLRINVPHLNVNTAFGLYFLVGALAAAANRREAYRRIARKPWVSVVVIAAVAVLLTCFDSAYGFRSGVVIAAIFVPIALGNSIFGLLTLRPFLLLGEISYSVYLIHGAILFVAFDLLFPRFMSTATSPLALNAGLSAVAAVAVLIAWATFTVVEKPCIDIGHRVSGARKLHAA